MGWAVQTLNIYNMPDFVGSILNIYDILIIFDGSKLNIKNIYISILLVREMLQASLMCFVFAH